MKIDSRSLKFNGMLLIVVLALGALFFGGCASMETTAPASLHRAVWYGEVEEVIPGHIELSPSVVDGQTQIEQRSTADGIALGGWRKWHGRRPQCANAGVASDGPMVVEQHGNR